MLKSRESLAADITRLPGNRIHVRYAAYAHWQPRNIFERDAAQAAIRGEQRSKKALGDQGRSRNRKNQRVPPDGNGRAIYVSATAEDQPPSPSAWLGSS